MTIKGPAVGGQAGILGQGTNPLSVYMTYQQRRAQNEYAVAQQQRKRRDDMFDYVGQYNPDAKWEPFQARVNEMAQTLVRNPVKEKLNQGLDPNQIQSSLGFTQGLVKNYIAETSTWKTTHDQAYKKVTEDAKYNEAAKSALNDIFFQPNGAPRENDEIRRDIQGIDHGIIFNPKLFNETVVAKKFMDTLEEQAKTTWGTIPKADGTYMTSQEIQGKLPYQRDANGLVVIDPHTQKPLMKMTDELYTLAKGSQDLRLLMESKGGNTRTGEEDYLKRLLPGLDKSSVKETVKEGFKKSAEDRKSEWAQFGWGYNVDPADLQGRYDILKGITDTNAEGSLGIFNHLTKDVSVKYADYKTDAKGNKIPTKISISFPSKADEGVVDPNKPVTIGDLALMGKTKIKTVDFPLNTEEERRAARVQLSEHLDQFDVKRSLGDNYAKFENEMFAKKGKIGVKMVGKKDIGL